ncbi:MAG TPA: ABC transporter substrate-binding protein, partial [Aestuariivirga sp.]|nr:ABC transporter substrate-binding protein [Aestuariivirga sp.]
PETQAELVKHLTYGVPTLAAYDLMSQEIRDSLPTAPDKAAAAAVYSDEYWVDQQAKATERFNTWVAQ